MESIFICKKCGFTWKNENGPQTCPICKHVYVEWLNYKESDFYEDSFVPPREKED